MFVLDLDQYFLIHPDRCTWSSLLHTGGTGRKRRKRRKRQEGWYDINDVDDLGGGGGGGTTNVVLDCKHTVDGVFSALLSKHRVGVEPRYV